jgi:hypothetical protein
MNWNNVKSRDQTLNWNSLLAFPCKVFFVFGYLANKASVLCFVKELLETLIFLHLFNLGESFGEKDTKRSFKKKRYEQRRG